jgi:hypothetical protein
MGHADYMKKVFEHQGIAMVKSVEFFEHEIPSAAFGFAIVKILFWITGPVSKHFQQRLKDASKETRIVFSDPSYWIVLPYTEKQKRQAGVKIPPPPLCVADNDDCICGCGGDEPDCSSSSQTLYNPFTDKVWTPSSDFSNEVSLSHILSKRQRLGDCRNSWAALNSIEDNFRFYDTQFGFSFDTY